MSNKNIVFYDDHCGLCNGFVKILIKLNIEGLYFAPLHGITYRELLDKKYDSYDSVIFYKSASVYVKSQAVIEILSLKSKLFKILKVIPKFILDPIYSFIAKHRKRIFYQDSCLVPSKEIRKKFLK